MAQLQSPETYVDGQQVTATRLNNQTNGATLLPGAITDQPNITANTVASGDSLLLYDLSATALREANVSDVLGSNLPVTTSAVTAGANSDVVITPNDGVVVTGSTYVSADAITVTVTTAVAHGLSVNQIVQIYGAGAGYGGVFKITAVTSLTFTYVLSSLYSTGASITITPTLCSYYTKGTNRVDGHSTVSGNQYASNVVTSYLEVNTQASFNTVNVTGAIQYNGTPVFGLYEISEETVPYLNQTSVAQTYLVYHTSASYTKPSDEIWRVEIVGNMHYSTQGYVAYKIKRTSGAVNLVGGFDVDHGVVSINRDVPLNIAAVENTGTAFTSTYTFEMAFHISGYALAVGQTNSVNTGGVTVSVPSTKFRIYKYKTA